MSHRLLFEDQGGRREVRLRGEAARVGREVGNDVVIAHPSVSRHHARLDFDGRSWTIVDLGSRNGVKLNGRALEPGEAGGATLNDGDTLVLGALRVDFRREETDRFVLEEQTGGAETGSATISRVSSLKDLIELPGAAASPEVAAVLERVERVLTLVAAVGQRITGVRPLEEVLESIVELVFESTPAERAALLLWEERVGRLVPKVVRTRGGVESEELRVSRSIVEKAYAERCTVQIDPDAPTSKSINELGIRSALAVPLWDQQRVIGVIYADTSILSGAFDPFSVALLSSLANYAAIAIEQTRLLLRLQQEERAKERLGRYHSRAVVERILATGDSSTDFAVEPQLVDVSVVFCDMVDFTAISERLEPQAVMLMLNEYFSRMTEAIFEHEGTLDKYIGDCIMAVFGAPLSQPDHARRSVLTALGLRQVVETLNSKRNDGGMNFRIGINSGRAVTGDLGHSKRREWTVLGSTVNLASRLESSVARPGQIVITRATRDLIGEEFETQALVGFQRPKGISRDLELFELIGRKA